MHEELTLFRPWSVSFNQLYLSHKLPTHNIRKGYKIKSSSQAESVRELTTTWASVSIQFISLECLTLLVHLAFQYIPVFIPCSLMNKKLIPEFCRTEFWLVQFVAKNHCKSQSPRNIWVGIAIVIK